MSRQSRQVKGKITEIAGAVTADRRVEAKGRVEQRVKGEPTDADVSKETRRVRREHKDTQS